MCDRIAFELLSEHRRVGGLTTINQARAAATAARGAASISVSLLWVPVGALVAVSWESGPGSHAATAATEGDSAIS